MILIKYLKEDPLQEDCFPRPTTHQTYVKEEKQTRPLLTWVNSILMSYFII